MGSWCKSLDLRVQWGEQCVFGKQAHGRGNRRREELGEGDRMNGHQDLNDWSRKGRQIRHQRFEGLISTWKKTKKWIGGGQVTATALDHNFVKKLGAFPVAQWVKNLPAIQDTEETSCRFHPRVGKIPWRRKWQPTPVFLPGKSHGHRSLVGYSPWWGSQRAWYDWMTKYTHIIIIKNLIQQGRRERRRLLLGWRGWVKGKGRSVCSLFNFCP